MSSINHVRAASLSSAAAPVAPRSFEPGVFTRKNVSMNTGAAGKDKALVSPAVLARELSAMFSAPGHRHFQYEGMPAIVQRSADGTLQVCDLNDRFVEIENGVIVDQKVLQGDILDFLAAAKNAH